MDNQAVCHARHGDYSKEAYLVTWTEGGMVAVCAVIDKEKEFEAPNPRFTNRAAGGTSNKLHAFFQKLITTGGEGGAKTFLYGDEKSFKIGLYLSHDGDVVVSTEDGHGSIGVVVRFTQTNKYYKDVHQMHRQLAEENERSPVKSAAKVFKEDKLHKIFL